MTALSQVTARLDGATQQIAKIGTETRALKATVEELKAVIAAGGQSTPELDTALANLEAQLVVVDDLVPDAETPAENPSV